MQMMQEGGRKEGRGRRKGGGRWANEHSLKIKQKSHRSKQVKGGKHLEGGREWIKMEEGRQTTQEGGEE